MVPRERVVVAMLPPSLGLFLLLPEGAEELTPVAERLPTATIFMLPRPLPRFKALARKAVTRLSDWGTSLCMVFAPKRKRT